VSRLRVVLDTNVLVSGWVYPGSVPGRIVAEWQQGGLEVALSQHILDELVRVLPRLKKSRRSAEEIRELADSLMFQAKMVEPGGAPDVELHGPDNPPVLQALLASGAQYLITGDKDLLALGERYPIITTAQFWTRHGA